MLLIDEDSPVPPEAGPAPDRPWVESLEVFVFLVLVVVFAVALAG